METVKISSKFQVVIPKKLRDVLKLLPGQKVQMVIYGNRIEMIPLRTISEMKGFLKGIDTAVERESDRLSFLQNYSPFCFYNSIFMSACGRFAPVTTQEHFSWQERVCFSFHPSFFDAPLPVIAGMQVSEGKFITQAVVTDRQRVQ